MITSNQWLEQLCCSNKNSNVLIRACRNKFRKDSYQNVIIHLTEILAGFFERVLDSDPSIERAGVWPEGWAYAVVAMPEVLYLLPRHRKIWETEGFWDTM
jgi:hypothetical protein